MTVSRRPRPLPRTLQTANESADRHIEPVQAGQRAGAGPKLASKVDTVSKVQSDGM